VSVLQWLCNADASSHSPPQRLQRFFATLAASLCRGARAAFQFYPESDDQVTFIMSFAVKAGFTGGLVVDYPNSSKKKKYYLVLISGQADSGMTSKTELPAALGVDEGEDTVAYERKRERTKKSRDGKRTNVKNKDWIMHKKQLNRVRGKEVPTDSKYVLSTFHGFQALTTT
jgi:18S rRNA (guanine1575-N7)-methyltransferase